jgi:hypothetical protein
LRNDLPDTAAMKQPISLRWQAASHYHTAVLAPDLFGD